MSRGDSLPQSAAEWLAHAESDLRLGRLGSGEEEILPAQICFHAQQAAEKALKAVLLSAGTDFPLTHDLGQLLELCGHAGIEIPPEILETDGLTPYAVETRYPGQLDEVTRAEMRHALMLAVETVAWARSLLDDG